MNRFQINATRWKQLATVVSDCVTVILKHSCLFILVWWRVFLRFLRHKTIVANFLHVMLLICKVFINNFSKGQFVVLFVAVSLWTEFTMLLKYFFIYFSVSDPPSQKLCKPSWKHQFRNSPKRIWRATWTRRTHRYVWKIARKGRIFWKTFKIWILKKEKIVFLSASLSVRLLQGQ